MSHRSFSDRSPLGLNGALPTSSIRQVDSGMRRDPVTGEALDRQSSPWQFIDTQTCRADIGTSDDFDRQHAAQMQGTQPAD